MTSTLASLLTSGLAFACIVSPSVQAQDEFCASSPTDMLAALDGDWTVSQGEGIAIGGLGVPLPAQGAQPMRLTFDPSTASATLSGGGQELTMFPSSIEQAEDLIVVLTDEDTKALLNPGEGCDWYALPVMLGGKPYDLSGSATLPTNIIWAKAFGKSVVYCSTGMQDTNSSIMVIPANDNNLGGGEYYSDETCKEMTVADIPPVSDGEMIMSVLIKFQSVNHGHGVLHFDGKMNGAAFLASAPITLTR